MSRSTIARVAKCLRSRTCLRANAQRLVAKSWLASPQGFLRLIALAFILVGIGIVTLAVGQWFPWVTPGADNATEQASIAALYLALLGIVGVASTILTGAFESLFVSEGKDVIHKFGAVKFPEDGGTADVYEHGAQKCSYPFPKCSVSLRVVRTHDEDKAGGKGAEAIKIFGLDGEFKPQECVVSMGSKEPEPIECKFLRVNRAFVLTAGAAETNLGTIKIEAEGGDVLATIGPKNGQTLQSIYTVPAGKVLLMRDWSISASHNVRVTATLQVREYIRECRGAERVLDRHFSAVAGYTAHEYPDNAPLLILEKSDLRIRTEVSDATSISGEFTGVLSPVRGRTTESGT